MTEQQEEQEKTQQELKQQQQQSLTDGYLHQALSLNEEPQQETMSEELINEALQVLFLARWQS